MRLDPRTSGFARIRGRIWLTGRAGDLQYDAVGVAQIDRPLGSVVFFLEVDARAAQSLAPRIERGIITYGERIVRQIRYAGEAFFRSEEHTSELQSLMRISYAVLCLKQKKDH